jgi:hypothetical protein
MRDRYSARAIDPICKSVDLHMENFARHTLNWRGEVASFGPIPPSVCTPRPHVAALISRLPALPPCTTEVERVKGPE